MLKWVQSGISSIAGTAEPEYGASAIHPVTSSLENTKAFRPTTTEDFHWKTPQFTNVETQTFYFTCLETGYIGIVQIIYSNVVGIHTTAQFNFRLYNPLQPENDTWSSIKLEDFECKGPNFYAKGVSVELVENKTYKITSKADENILVELSLTRSVDGVIFGEDGTTYYGDDITQPWGTMRHAFWPRCIATGLITFNPSSETEKKVDIKGFSILSMALQGMKPHHAAKSWNFLNFHSPNHSAIQMEFTTPKSYGYTRVSVGIVTNDKEILACSVDNHVIGDDGKEPEADDVGWAVPKKIEFKFNGWDAKLTPEEINKFVDTELTSKLDAVKIAGVEATTPASTEAGEEVVQSADGRVKTRVYGNLDKLVERVDVMHEIPQFIKTLVSGVAGTKPYIYQYSNEMEIEIHENNKIEKEKGIAFNEITFISA